MTRELIPYLQGAHAVFNAVLLLGLLSLGIVGWGNRRNRLAGRPMNAPLVRRHRRWGVILAGILPFSYLGGLGTVFLDFKTLLKFPLHLGIGTLLLAAVGLTYLASRKIRGLQSPWRTRHFLLGLACLVLFLAQAVLGLDVLL